MAKRPLIVGITGGSGSGKTTLVKRLVERNVWSVTELPQDRYYRDLSHLALEDRTTINFDCPGALDVELFLRHIDDLSIGKSVRAPRYDFKTHTRSGEETILPAEIIVIDGTLILSIDGLRERLDLSVYVDAPPDIRLIRKIQRDLSERGRTLEFSIAQYLNTVRPMHERYTASFIEKADLVLDGTKPEGMIVEELVSALNSIFR